MESIVKLFTTFIKLWVVIAIELAIAYAVMAILFIIPYHIIKAIHKKKNNWTAIRNTERIGDRYGNAVLIAPLVIVPLFNGVYGYLEDGWLNGISIFIGTGIIVAIMGVVFLNKIKTF